MKTYLIIDTKYENCYKTIKEFNSLKVKNPKHVNNGLNHIYNSLNLEECEIAKKAYIEYYSNYKLTPLFKTLEFYKKTKYDDKYTKENIKLVEKELEEYSKIPADKIKKYYLYESIAYIFDEMPSKDIINKIVNDSIDMYDDEYDGYRIVEVEETITNNDLKVKVTAYKENIIIETIDSDEYDNDFSPNKTGNIGCTLTNPKRLGISKEALSLLKQIKRCRDAIGDFMWDSNSFSWIGNPLSIKDLKSVGDRSFQIQNTFIEIENIVPQEAIDEIENDKEVIIDYNDIEFEPWIEISRNNINKNIFDVDIICHEKRLYDKVNIVNVPDNSLIIDTDDCKIVHIQSNDLLIMKEKIKK